MPGEDACCRWDAGGRAGRLLTALGLVREGLTGKGTPEQRSREGRVGRWGSCREREPSFVFATLYIPKPGNPQTNRGKKISI